jgi:hypothetical protein
MTDPQTQPSSKDIHWHHHPHNHHHDIVGALILITIGGILLLNNLGLLPWSVWHNLWRYWPVILILTGVQMVIGRSLMARVVMFFFTLAVIFLILDTILHGIPLTLKPLF